MSPEKRRLLALAAQLALKDVPNEQGHEAEISLLKIIADASAPLSTVAEAAEKLIEMFPDSRSRNETFAP